MEPAKRRPARLVDVARAAGVHVSTVSRVLNGRSDDEIRPQTRERIVEAAHRLRYRPNAIARGLKLATTGALGLLVPSLRNPVMADIIRGAFARAWERDFVVLLAEDSEETDGPAAYERLVAEGRIDGILIASARPGNPLLDRFSGERVPCVFVNRRHPDGGQNVSMREEDAGRIAAEHLLALGHRRLAHLGGPAALDTACRRAHGFMMAAEAAGVDAALVHAPFTERGGYDGLHHLLAGAPRPTGVFASNINQAVGATAGARASRIRIPEDISLIGYDDDPLGEFLETPLTAIRMPLFELGATAVDVLIDRLHGQPPRDVILTTAPVLVERASTTRPSDLGVLTRTRSPLRPGDSPAR